MDVPKQKIINFLEKEVLGNPPISSKDLQVIESLLSDFLKNSDNQTRKELQDFLKRWEARVLFVNMLQEEKDIEDKKIK